MSKENIVTPVLNLFRTTKGTYRFDFDGDGFSPITSVYISKAAFPEGPPEEIELTVRVVK